ncbi:fungal-specific transcription factor domain-containing protein [Aspergillus nidulans var. acristatus]
MEQIVPYMLCAPKEFANPFIQDVLPMAFSDPLIMNAVMALGGSTLGVHQPIDQEVKISFFKSYGDAINELKHRLAHWAADQSSESEGIRIFLAVLLMCHYEAIRGNQKGEFFVHLRAGRVLAPVVHATRDGPLAPLVGVLLENYVYFELWSCLRLTPDDSDISAAAQVAIPQLDALRHMHTFGVMFGDAAEIFQYAPEICKLATRRKIEVETGSDLGCAATFQRLKSEITSCKGCTDNNHYHRHHHNDHNHPDTDQTFAQGRIAAGIVSQSAVFLFLLSAYLQDLDTDYLCEVSQPLVERMIDVLPQLRRTSFANTCFWPVIVTASYATTELQRQRITEYFLPFMPIIVRALELLQWVWETEGAFGLAGLAMVVEDHGTSYCFG